MIQNRNEDKAPMEYRRICGWGDEANERYYEPLTPENFDGLFDDAEVAAYKNIVSFVHSLKVGAQIQAKVYRPFCCAEGDIFWTVYEDNEKRVQFVQAKLLSILTYGESYAQDCAIICVEVLQIRDILSFVRPVQGNAKKQLMQEHKYNYAPPEGDSEFPGISIENNWITISNGTLGGEVSSYHCIYTDADGIDHLVLAGESYCELCLGEFMLAGDRVLGFHVDCPFH